MERPEPVERGDDKGVALVEVAENLPGFLAFGVLAGLLTGEEPDAARLVEGGDPPIEQLSLRRYAGVPDKSAGPYGRNGSEKVRAVVILEWSHPRDRTENGAAQVLERADFLTPFYEHDPAPIRPRTPTYRSCLSNGRWINAGKPWMCSVFRASAPRWSAIPRAGSRAAVVRSARCGGGRPLG